MNRWYSVPVAGVVGALGYGLYTTFNHNYSQAPLSTPLFQTVKIDPDKDDPFEITPKTLPIDPQAASPESISQTINVPATVVPVAKPVPTSTPPTKPVTEPAPVPVQTPAPTPAPTVQPPQESQDTETKSPIVEPEKKVASSAGAPSPVSLTRSIRPTTGAPMAKQKTNDAEDDASYLKELSSWSLAKRFRSHLLLAKKDSKVWGDRSKDLLDFYKEKDSYISVGYKDWISKAQMTGDFLHDWCKKHLSGGVWWNSVKLGQPSIWFPRIWRWCSKDPHKTPPKDWWYWDKPALP